MNIGFIGLGLMGRPMALNLLRGGHALHVWTRRPDSMEALLAAGQAPLFLPYLQGERTPHNNALARGVFFGLNSSHEAAGLAYAVLKGVTPGLMDCWCAMGQSGEAATSLTLVGGGARNATWAQMISSGLRSQILRPRHAHSAAAIGAARLGWLATGGTIMTHASHCPHRTFSHRMPMSGWPCLPARKSSGSSIAR